MYTYFSTFIPGLGEIVKKQLSNDLKKVTVELLLDGLIIYKSPSPIETVRKLRYFNNSFLLLKKFDDVENRQPLEKIAKLTLAGNLSQLPKQGKNFRLMFYLANEPTAMPKFLLSKLENKFSKIYKLEIDRTNPSNEFWILYRKEKLGLVGLRLTKHPDWKKVLLKGQLRPELANLLCIISDMSAEDIVLDPFAGSGAIAQERKLFPHRSIVSSDINPAKKDIRKLDVLNLSNVMGNNSISKIITDPPWGISVGKDLNLQVFYKKMLKEFSKVLKLNGLAIVLIGNKEVFENVLKEVPNLKLLQQYNILVSGKKASIYKLIKLLRV